MNLSTRDPHNKLYRMPSDARAKTGETIEKL